MPDVNHRSTVAVIGGGFTGAAVAWNLARKSRKDAVRIAVYEPRATIGAGLAYDTSNPSHRINVPADRMSLDPDAMGDFLDWVKQQDLGARDSQAVLEDGRIFPRRQDFGAYVTARLRPYLAENRIEHRQTEIAHVERDASRWRLKTTDGTVQYADAVVIATSHPSPSPPRALANALAGHRGFIADTTQPEALCAVQPQHRVLIVGNGLTAADIAATLLDAGHTGPITSISRRGLRSRGHPQAPQEPFGDFTSQPVTSVRRLTRQIREEIAHAEALGISWHAVLDSVRSQAQTIWPQLPVDERRRLVRHLRPFWDVHRFRIAPQIEAAIDRAVAGGQMQILAASVLEVVPENDQITVTLRKTRSRSIATHQFDSVVIATGPAHGGIIGNQPFLRDLAAAGLADLDPTGLGLACDRQSRLLDAQGNPTPGLFVAGPLARGTFGELMGLPQVSEHARQVADHLADTLGLAAGGLQAAEDAA